MSEMKYRIFFFGGDPFVPLEMSHCHIQALNCCDLFIVLSNNWLPVLSRLFLGTDSNAASSPVRETPRSPPTGSSGESMDSVSVSSSDSSSPSDSEGLTPTHTSDSQQNKVCFNTKEGCGEGGLSKAFSSVIYPFFGSSPWLRKKNLCQISQNNTFYW